MPYLSGDNIRLIQILINLIKNALKHTKNGSIKVLASYNYIEQMLVMHVIDSGRGIRHEDISLLFHRFGKLADPTHLNTEGIGLGLTICEAIIRVNQGEIEITSDGIDQGTRVKFSMKMESISSDELPEEELLEEERIVDVSATHFSSKSKQSGPCIQEEQQEPPEYYTAHNQTDLSFHKT